MKRILNVCVTGACGNIASSLYNILCAGEPFGTNVEMDLRLFDVEEKINHLKALKVQLQDCCYKHIRKISVTVSLTEAFSQVDVVIFLGSMPRKPGVYKQEFYEQNAKIFSHQGRILNDYAKKTCKSLVVANPVRIFLIQPNTNCLVLAENAPTIPAENFTALTRWDYNRLSSSVKLF